MAVSSNKFKYTILFLFVCYFGYTLPFAAGSDAIVHNRHVVEHYVGLSFERFLLEAYHILIFDPLPTTSSEIYIHLISYLTGGILEMPLLFKLIVGAVFGFFMLKSYKVIFDLAPFSLKDPFVVVLFGLIFISFLFIDNMQTVRTWTGLWILFYAVIMYSKTSKKTYLLLMIVPPMVHFAFWAMALPVWLGVLLKKYLKPKWIFLVYVGSFFVGDTADFMVKYGTSTELGKDKFETNYFVNEVLYEQKKNQVIETNWYVMLGKGPSKYNFTHYSIFFLSIFGFFSRKKVHPLVYDLIFFGILLAIFSNITKPVDQLSGRTLTCSGIFMAASIFIVVYRHFSEFKTTFLGKFKKIALLVGVGIYFPALVFTLSNLLSFTSFFTVIPVFMGVFQDIEGTWAYSLRDLIGDIW